MHATSASKVAPRPRKRDIVFVTVSGGFFALTLSVVGTVCVVCTYPATVMVFG